MDPLDFLDHEELLQFFHCKKTTMSCMENPRIFLSQLKDHRLIPDDRFKKVSRMKSKENLKRGVYETLDWLERERPEHIHRFWSCVFQDTIINEYPILRELRNSLMDGSFHFCTKLPEVVESEQTNENNGKELSNEEDEEETHLSSRTKKRKASGKEADEGGNHGDEQPGPSLKLKPGQRKRSKRICFSSPLKKGEKGDIWNWPMFKLQLPVTCGDLEAALNRTRLAEGEKCILFQKQWFTPAEFETRAGKRSSGNWRLSIRCSGVPLGNLIQEGHLRAGEQAGGSKVKKSLFPSEVFTVCEDEDDEGNVQEDQASSREGSTPDGREEAEGQKDAGGSRKVFKVTCDGVTGTLHKSRFASGTCGKSIRTEMSWMSPVEFVEEASNQTKPDWERDIECEGRPLCALIDENTLEVHPLLCGCRLCQADESELENQKNDDECFACKGADDRKLVECDACPRSFHQRCHLPHVEDSILRDDKWICTFCVFKNMQECRYSDELEMEAATSQQISQRMLECQYLLLLLLGADEEQFFAEDPRPYLKKYSAHIRTPMWFVKVADKLQNGKYQTVEEFVSDVQLIFSNCFKYNRGNTEILELGRQLQQLFDEEFKKVFSISEWTADS
ncbi:nuclear body protein SP140-like protein isoform X2 [Betta splendens]|uniref:Nuclear body protein SP140-like protein isoform X2 n=1 Tax=Betta splendens TaxID=158456 RepID=A0A6P7N9B5_BETSP|nr:nuclear body protein SP140-like protein isoform X2 [Betta splendens]